MPNKKSKKGQKNKPADLIQLAFLIKLCTLNRKKLAKSIANK